MSELQPDPESTVVTPEAILRRLTRISLVLGHVGDVMTELARLVLIPPEPPIIPLLNTIVSESALIEATATRLGGTTNPTAPALTGALLVGPDPDPGVGLPPAVLARRVTRVARILARVDDRLTTLAHIISQIPPEPPILPVLSVIADQARATSALATTIINVR